MPRKSAEKRLKDTLFAIDVYEEFLLKEVFKFEYKFLCQMQMSMERGKYPTSKQRSLLDKIHAGLDHAKAASTMDSTPIGSEVLVQRIDKAIQEKGIEKFDFRFLSDMASTLRLGRKLSDKQMALTMKCLAKTDGINLHGFYEPSEDIIADLRLAVKFITNRNPYFPYNSKVSRWLEDYDVYNSSNVTGARLPVIDKVSVETMLSKKNVVGMLKRIKTPQFALGDICSLKKSKNMVAIIVSDPYISQRGIVSNDLLISGEIVSVDQREIKKFKESKGKK